MACCHEGHANGAYEKEAVPCHVDDKTQTLGALLNGVHNKPLFLALRDAQGLGHDWGGFVALLWFLTLQHVGLGFPRQY